MAEQHGEMGQRGVTRHDMEMDRPPHGQATQADSSSGGGHEEMSQAQRHQMMVEHHRKTLWVWWSVVMLGVWLLVTPLTFSFAMNPAHVPEREVWLSLEARIAAMHYSDLICGALLIVLGWRMLTPGRLYSRWAACFVGIWLTGAPLLFWSPSPLAYLNDTLVGAAVIALTLLIPGMPAMMMFMQHGPQTPPGWSYNPSSWPQRWIMIVLSFAGWLVSRYLAARQLGFIDRAWDPFFGAGSEKVLMSRMSHMWPVSDAGLGAFSYTFEFLMGFMGSPARWRTMPWMVLVFGVLVIPLGLTHVILVISQPVAVGEWCTLCLLAAGIMLPMIPLEIDEVVAMCQFMRKAVWRDGKPFWRTFWKGGTLEMQQAGRGGADERSPALHTFPQHPLAVFRASTWGMSIPWTLACCALLGTWMTISPAVLGTSGGDRGGSFTMPDSSHLAGALTVVVSVCAMGEVIRTARFLNLPLALWMATAPFILSGGNTLAAINGVVAAILLIALTLPRGKVREHYGDWDLLIR